MRFRRGPNRLGDLGQPGRPRGVGRRKRRAGEQQLNQPVEQGLLAVHVAVERHRRHAELLHAVTRSGTYRHSAEELTPARWADAGADPVTALPVAAAALATLIRPAAWRHFAAGDTSAYSLTPAAWRRLLDTAAAGHLNAAR